MTGHKIELSGFRLSKSGKLERNIKRLSVSAQLQRRAKNKVRLGIIGDVVVTRGNWLTGEMSTKRYTPEQYAKAVSQQLQKKAKTKIKVGKK